MSKARAKTRRKKTKAKSKPYQVKLEVRDHKRWQEIEANLIKANQIRSTNIEVRGFLLKSYIKKGEKVVSADPKLGVLMVVKE